MLAETRPLPRRLPERVPFGPSNPASFPVAHFKIFGALRLLLLGWTLRCLALDFGPVVAESLLLGIRFS
jgi:hypothetical protein